MLLAALLPAIGAVLAGEKVWEVVVYVEVGPGDVVAAENFDVGELFRCGVLEALKEFALDDEAGAVVDLEDDEVEGAVVLGGDGGGVWWSVSSRFCSRMASSSASVVKSRTSAFIVLPPRVKRDHQNALPRYAVHSLRPTSSRLADKRFVCVSLHGLLFLRSTTQ
jgi:hypothetical protein